MEILPAISIKKILHRNEFRIAIFFSPNKEIKEKVIALGASWTHTHKCWYVDYSKEKYNALLNTFPVVEILKESNPEPTFQNTEPDLHKKHDTAPIVRRDDLAASKDRLHKEVSSAIETYKLRIAGSVGKYWILCMKYSEEMSTKLLQIKGVYWNKSQKAYMVMRHVNVKVKVEALLGIPGFFPSNYYQADLNEKAKTGLVTIQPHVADKKFMEIITPPISSFIQQIKRLRGSRFSKSSLCYLIPATPDFLSAVCRIANETGLQQEIRLNKGYVHSKNTPNQKSLNLQEIRLKLILQTPIQVTTYVSAMIDYLMALNYSHNTIKNYTGAFLLFLRRHQYRNPDTLEQKDIIRYLAGMMQQGLSSSTAHMLVNALLFYYRNVLKKSSFELIIPRPKKEKKLPQVLTMAECLNIFKAISNPKHKLLMMLGYGAGLRLNEIVTLQWQDIQFAEFKIHIKGAKGHKDRLVMLPYSIITYLQEYRKMFGGDQWVFEGQNKGEPYSGRSVQQVLQQAIIKSGLEKRASVHTLTSCDRKYDKQFYGTYENIDTNRITYSRISFYENNKYSFYSSTCFNGIRDSGNFTLRNNTISFHSFDLPLIDTNHRSVKSLSKLNFLYQPGKVL